MLKLSLIIPVYNVELYLRKCLDSVLNQGLNEDEYEVILVDDGSKDGSLSICNEYAEKHPNFKIISLIIIFVTFIFFGVFVTVVRVIFFIIIVRVVVTLVVFFVFIIIFVV